MKRLVAVFGLVLLVASDSCDATHRWFGASPVFPSPDGPVALALRDPLLVPDPAVEAVAFAASGARSKGFWMEVASERPDVVLRERTLEEIGLDLPARSKGGTRLVPRVALGDLRLRDVIVSAGESPALGQSVLGHGPWEIDWDRGTLTLWAPPWPEGTSGAVHVPLRREDDVDLVVMEAAGLHFDMAISTGRGASEIPAAIGNVVMTTGFLDRAVGRLLEAEASIGSLKVGVHPFLAPLEGHKSHGFLGLDVLSNFKMRVVPGKELWLAPRQDLLQTAPARIARWGASRHCREVGCVRARLEHEPPPGWTLVIDVDEGFAYPSLLVLACGGDSTPLVPFWSETDAVYWRWLQHKPAHETPHHIVVQMTKDMTGRIVTPLVQDVVGAFPPWEQSCTDLSVIDVVPLEPKDVLPNPPAHPWTWRWGEVPLGPPSR